MKKNALLTFLILEIIIFSIYSITLFVAIWVMYSKGAFDIVYSYNIEIKTLFFMFLLFYIAMFIFSSLILYKVCKKEEKNIYRLHLKKLYKPYNGVIEVEEIIMRIYTLLNVKNIFVDMDIKSLPRTITGDKVLLRRALEMLCINLVKNNDRKIGVKIYTDEDSIIFNFIGRNEEFEDFDTLKFILNQTAWKIKREEENILIAKKI